MREAGVDGNQGMKARRGQGVRKKHTRPRQRQRRRGRVEGGTLAETFAREEGSSFLRKIPAQNRLAVVAGPDSLDLGAKSSFQAAHSRLLRYSRHS